MTPKERAAMQQALEALEESIALNKNWVSDSEPETLAYFSEHKAVIEQGEAVITALREALEQPVSQEPVAEVNQYGITVSDDNWGERMDYKCAVCGKGFMSYTAAYNHYSTIHRKGATCIDL